MPEKTNAEIYAERLAKKYGPDWKEIFRAAGRKANGRNGPGFAANRELAREAGRKGHRVARERHGEELFVKAREKAWSVTRGSTRKRKDDRPNGAGHTVPDGTSAKDQGNQQA